MPGRPTTLAYGRAGACIFVVFFFCCFVFFVVVVVVVFHLIYPTSAL